MIIILLCLLGFIIYKEIYDSRNHCEYTSSSLKENAQIIDVKREIVGFKGSKRWRTTIFFDDGFTYIAHDTTRTDSLLSYSISVSKEQNAEIFEKALDAHTKTVQKIKGISESASTLEEHTVEPKKNDSDSDYKSESQVKVSLSDSTQPIQTTPNESRLTRGVDIALITEPVQDPSPEPVREPSPKSMPAPEPVQEPISQSTAHVSDPNKEITCTTAGSATPKRQKYCSRCGSLIKKTDTRCPGCNRRIMRLRINKFTVTIFVLLLIIAGLTGLNIIQYGYVQNEKKDLQYIKKELENIREEKKAVTESFHYYLRYWEKNCDKVNFFDQSIVFVIDGYSNYYFTYDQMMLVTKGLESYSCWAYNTEQAIAKGYIAWK